MAEHDDVGRSESTQTRTTSEWVDVRGADDVLLLYEPGLRGSTRAVVMDLESEAIGSFKADHFDAEQCREVARIIWRTHDSSFARGKDAGANQKARELRHALGLPTDT